MKYEVIYFREFVKPSGARGLFADSIQTNSMEHAAYLFNKKYFSYFKYVTFDEFRKQPPHFRYWGLTINGNECGKLALAAQREYIKKWRAANEEQKRWK